MKITDKIMIIGVILIGVLHIIENVVSQWNEYSLIWKIIYVIGVPGVVFAAYSHIRDILISNS